jgi:hypothetical protein
VINIIIDDDGNDDDDSSINNAREGSKYNKGNINNAGAAESK